MLASVVYLPQHMQFVIRRAWFYMHGYTHDSAAAAVAKEAGAMAHLLAQRPAEALAAAAAQGIPADILKEL